MKTAELVAEHLAAWKVTTESDLDELVRYGLPRQLIQQIRPAVANIVVDKKGELYAPDEAGVRAWVLPVRVFDPEMPDVIEAINPVWAVSCSDVIDLVAFSPAAPRRFALRRGIATVLGSIEPQY